MGDHKLKGTPDIGLTLRRSARARRMTLRISSIDGRVTLTLPKWVSDGEALRFAREKESWIRGHLSRQPQTCIVGPGAVLPVEGRDRYVCDGAGPRIALGADRLMVPPGRAGASVQAWLKELARDRLVEAADHYAGLLQRRYTRLSLRDTRSRWGSCSTEGRLMFCWRLIMAPPDVLRYVAAHEVAHLAEMNHSEAFWDTVARIHGPHDAPRRWLREEGAALHRFRF